uniref:Uncharacterized protein n=1 Tax=Molossus molossus TaxID=27622 RepID=A0A7J8JWK5_MOLMO|nr:hypothetical protein HJG59_007885 [Molossus molossus]
MSRGWHFPGSMLCRARVPSAAGQLVRAPSEFSTRAFSVPTPGPQHRPQPHKHPQAPLLLTSLRWLPLTFGDVLCSGGDRDATEAAGLATNKSETLLTCRLAPTGGGRCSIHIHANHSNLSHQHLFPAHSCKRCIKNQIQKTCIS